MVHLEEVEDEDLPQTGNKEFEDDDDYTDTGPLLPILSFTAPVCSHVYAQTPRCPTRTTTTCFPPRAWATGCTRCAT